MYRFERIEKAISKGVKVDESKSRSSGEIIRDWSPNNIKRIVIGAEGAFIEYHVTTKRYPKFTEKVPLVKEMQSDLQTLQTNPKEYEPILAVLVSKRIISSIEEIIFCTQDYPQPLLQRDLDLKIISKGNVLLENRFPRLRHISMVDSDVRGFFASMASSKYNIKELFLWAMEGDNIPHKKIVSINEDNWWSGSALRPQFYELDGGKLKRHFEELKEEKQQELRDEKLRSLNAQRDKEDMIKHFPAVRQVMVWIEDLNQSIKNTASQAGVIDWMQWTNCLNDKWVVSQIRRGFRKNDTLVTLARRVDYDRVKEAIESQGYEDDSLELFDRFRGVLFEHLIDQEEYKRESNKDNLTTSLQSLKKITGFVFNTEVNIVYLTLIKHLIRVSEEYVKELYEKLLTTTGRDSLEVIYTRSNIRFINELMDEGVAKRVFDIIGAKEVLVEEFSLPQRYQESMKLLDVLREYLKSK